MKRRTTVIFTPLSDAQKDQVDRGHSAYVLHTKWKAVFGHHITFVLPILNVRNLFRVDQ